MILVFWFILMNINFSKQKESQILIRDCQTSKKQQLPNGLIIGVRKSGTYALLRYLSLNSQIIPALKVNGAKLNEIHYFDSNENYAQGLEWYKSQMPYFCQQNENDHFLVIEKTPGYFHDKKSIERIKNYKKNVKLILIVRDPIKRLRSQLTHCYYKQKMERLNRTCLEMNKYYEKIFTNSNSSMLINDKFVNSSIYYLNLKNWLEHFKLNESLIVIDGDKFIEKPWIELNRIEKFLGVNVSIGREDFVFNKEKSYYCLNKTNDSCLGRNKGRKYQVYLSDYVKQNLKQYFSKWNSLFFDLIGQKFNW